MYWDERGKYNIYGSPTKTQETEVAAIKPVIIA